MQVYADRSGQVYDGSKLREIRENKNIDLDQIAVSTKIQKVYLKSIEEENFNMLPPPVFIVGYLKNYSRFLNIDPEKVVQDFKSKLDAWQATTIEF